MSPRIRTKLRPRRPRTARGWVTGVAAVAVVVTLKITVGAMAIAALWHVIG